MGAILRGPDDVDSASKCGIEGSMRHAGRMGGSGWERPDILIRMHPILLSDGWLGNAARWVIKDSFLSLTTRSRVPNWRGKSLEADGHGVFLAASGEEHPASAREEARQAPNSLNQGAGEGIHSPREPEMNSMGFIALARRIMAEK